MLLTIKEYEVLYSGLCIILFYIVLGALLVHGRFTLVRITSESIQRTSIWYGKV